jgi:hypothetical protein
MKAPGFWERSGEVISHETRMDPLVASRPLDGLPNLLGKGGEPRRAGAAVGKVSAVLMGLWRVPHGAPRRNGKPNSAM